MQARLQCDIVLGSSRAIEALLAEMQSEQELFDSPNTLKAVEEHLLVIAQTLAHLPLALRLRLDRLDQDGWQALQRVLEQDRQPRREEVWYGISALMPATLHLLAELQRREPRWFSLSY